MTRERIKELAKLEEDLTMVEEISSWFEDDVEWPNKYIRDINGNAMFSKLPKKLQENIIDAIRAELNTYINKTEREFSAI